MLSRASKNTDNGALGMPVIEVSGNGIIEEASPENGSGNWRHGDLKAENILRLTDSSWLGRLQIADLGRAKLHSQTTGRRRAPTSTESWTIQYEAPEAKTAILKPRSRLFDIWSLGCVMLEMVVWFLYGEEKLNQFWNQRINTMGETLFYTATGNTAKVNEISSNLMQDILAHDLECNTAKGTALGDLLKLVQDRLLVVALPGASGAGAGLCRIDATALCQQLELIIQRCGDDPEYLFTGVKRANVRLPRVLADLGTGQIHGQTLSPNVALERPGNGIFSVGTLPGRATGLQAARVQQVSPSIRSHFAA